MKCKNKITYKKYGGAVAAPVAATLPRRANYNQLIITLNTNLPTDKYGKTKQITLTGNMLGAGKYNNAPYFSTDVLYSDYKQYFVNLPNEKILDVFFKEGEFDKFIQKCLNFSKKTENYDTMRKNPLEPSVDGKSGYAAANIMFMLNKLISISFPTPSFVGETYVESFYTPPYILGLKSSTILNIEGKPYTVIKADWQNDFYSNPEYNNIYLNFLDYDSWYSNNKAALIERSIKEFNELYLLKGIRDITVYDENIVEYMVNEFAINFTSLDDAKKKLSNITVPLTIDVRDMEKRRYGPTETYKDYTNKIFGYKKTSLEYEVNLSKSLSRTRETPKENEKNDYFRFIERVYSIISSYSEWKTFSELKKETLADIKSNKYNSQLKSLLEKLTDINKYKEDIEKRKFYTGAEQDKNGKYKIVLYIDLVGGKIDKTNASNVSCAYKSKMLGSEFETLWDGTEGLKERIFIDVNKDIAEADAKAAATAPAAPAAVGGGKKTRKIRYNNKSSTRRRRRGRRCRH